MATHASTRTLAEADRKRTGDPGYVARQPILDQRGKVHGYELLFWGGGEPKAKVDGEPASSAVLDAASIFGLDELRCGLPAFVHCSLDSLTGDWLQHLPPRTTVLELPSGGQVPPGVPAALSKLKAAGFRLALEDFAGEPESWSLAALADYIKVDIARVNADTRRNLFRRLEGSKAYAVATNVETQEQYAEACQDGFGLFQGYYFCRPEPVKNHRIPGNRLVHLEILEDLQNDPVDMHRLSQLVMCDADLTFRLLRFVNSPLFAIHQEVASIQMALNLVGEATFRRIAMLAIASDFNTGQPAEILRMAFERARFCELAGGLCGLPPGEQYLIGMVSLFPAMLRILMEDLLPLLPLRAAACDALLGKPNPEGVLLRWRQCEEHGDWAACDEIVRSAGMDHGQVMHCHAEALAWASTALN
jgi:EAL and modified HD-GYP domain-containing signal transduction protein